MISATACCWPVVTHGRAGRQQRSLPGGDNTSGTAAPQRTQAHLASAERRMQRPAAGAEHQRSAGDSHQLGAPGCQALPARPSLVPPSATAVNARLTMCTPVGLYRGHGIVRMSDSRDEASPPVAHEQK